MKLLGSKFFPPSPILTRLVVIIGLVIEVLGLVIRIPKLPKVPNNNELSLTSESDLTGCFPLLS